LIPAWSQYPKLATLTIYWFIEQDEEEAAEDRYNEALDIIEDTRTFIEEPSATIAKHLPSVKKICHALEFAISPVERDLVFDVQRSPRGDITVSLAYNDEED